MAAAAASVANTVLDCFDRVVALGNKYYIQDADWRDLEVKVSKGRQVVKAWDEAAANRGLSSHEALAEPLNLARRTVEEEEAKMQKELATRKTNFFRKLKRTLLPAHVKLRVQNVVECLERIPQTLRMLQEVPETLDKIVTDRQPFLQIIPSDSRYVHFNDTEAAITEALEKDHGRPVLLLHGGAGTGKSTVVRNINRSLKESSFDKVVFKDCGSEDEVDYIEFLVHFIQRLGETVVDSQTVNDQQREIPLQRQVKTFLSARKWLFILDNLVDEKFLLKMVNLSDIKSGGNVKFLVTAQEYGLCGSIDPVRHLEMIPIQELDEGTAREILASHAGFSNHQIPCHLLRVANKMIAQTDRNPLALAMLGGAMARIAGCDEKLRNDREQWGLLSENIFEALKEDKCPIALFQQPKYRRSLWATLELIIKEKLSTGCRNLLLVAHSFAENSFPEAVIRLLFSRLRGVQGDFGVFKEELTQRNLITRRTEPASGKTTWHLHSLQKLYINSEMVRSRASVINLLIGDDEIAASGGMDHIGNHRDHIVVLTLCARYLQKPLAEKAAAKIPIGHGRRSFAHSCDYCILSICSISRPVTDQWTLEDREQKKEDFLSHIYGPVEDLGMQEFLPRCPI